MGLGQSLVIAVQLTLVQGEKNGMGRNQRRGLSSQKAGNSQSFWATDNIAGCTLPNATFSDKIISPTSRVSPIAPISTTQSSFHNHSQLEYYSDWDSDQRTWFWALDVTDTDTLDADWSGLLPSATSVRPGAFGSSSADTLSGRFFFSLARIDDSRSGNGGISSRTVA